MGWGIVYPPYSILNMGGNPPPQTRWVYNFNGVSQRVEVSPIYLNLGDTVTVTCSKPTTPNATILDGFGRAFRIRLEPDGTIRIDGFTGTVNGLPIGSGVTIWPEGISTFELTRSDATVDYFTAIGSRSDIDVTYFNGLIYNFKINDGSVYNYPMDDRTFGLGAVIANSATVLGPELVVNGNFDTDVSYWSKPEIISWSNGRLKLDPTGSYQSSGQNVNVTPNVPHLFKCNVETLGTGMAQGYIQVRDVASNTVLYQKKGTAYSEVLITPKGTEVRIYLQGNQDLAVTYFDNISLKKAEGYATGINLLESGWTEINI